MKKILLVSVLAVFGLMGCGGDNNKEASAAAKGDSNKVYEVKFAHVVSANTPKGRAADFFAKRVEELTEGKIKVHVFPSAQLVDDDKVFQELKRNNVQLAAPSFSKFTPFAKEFNLWDVPFIFRDTEHLHKVMDGEVGKILKDVISSKGYIALDYWDAGFKQFSTNKKPIIEPSDAEGQNLQEKFSTAMREATIFEREESAKEEKMLLDKLKADDKTNTTIYELDEAQKQRWQDVMIAIYPKFYDLIGKDLIEKTLNTK